MMSDTVQLREDLLSLGYDGVVIFENPSYVDARSLPCYDNAPIIFNPIAR